MKTEGEKKVQHLVQVFGEAATDLAEYIHKLEPVVAAVNALDPKRDAAFEAMREALSNLVNAKALMGVRDIVAGWNGERLEKPHKERHPSRLGATLPKTTCGAVYELDEAMVAAFAALALANGEG